MEPRPVGQVSRIPSCGEDSRASVHLSLWVDYSSAFFFSPTLSFRRLIGVEIINELLCLRVRVTVSSWEEPSRAETERQ